MSRNRFSFFPDRDNEILKHADEIEVKLLRLRNGRLGIMFKISGGHLPGWNDDGDEDDSELATESVDAERLADSLMRRFCDAGREGGAE